MLLPRLQVRRLQDAALQQEREKLQQHVAWTQEKQLMEKELGLHKEKVRRTTKCATGGCCSSGICYMSLPLPTYRCFVAAGSRVSAGGGD